MSKTKNSQTKSVPQWQSNKMKTLIVERWHEVWEVVEAREQNRNQQQPKNFCLNKI